MDPLTVLRDFATRGDLSKILRSGDEFIFGDDIRFPATIDTAFRSKQGSPYPLDVLIYFLHHHNLKHTDYILASRRHGVSPVTLPDRKPLLDYLLGRVSSSDSIIPLPNPLPFQIDLEAPPPSDHDLYPDQLPDPETLDPISTILEYERPLRDRNALLVCRNRNFFAVYAAAMEREEKRRRTESHQRKDGVAAKSRLMEESVVMGGGGEKKSGKGGKVGEGVPIILVPSASSTLITIYNVKEFLEDGVFVAADVKVKEMKGVRPECVTVQKKFGRDKDRAVQAYEVRDKPSGLKAEDWDRVVAVFVLGKEWQFKDWPFKDHVGIFNKIIGFFMRFEDDSVESAKTVKQWNVKIISISKNKRHQDRAAALEVWDRLEEFMRARSHS